MHAARGVARRAQRQSGAGCDGAADARARARLQGPATRGSCTSDSRSIARRCSWRRMNEPEEGRRVRTRSCAGDGVAEAISKVRGGIGASAARRRPRFSLHCGGASPAGRHARLSHPTRKTRTRSGSTWADGGAERARWGRLVGSRADLRCIAPRTLRGLDALTSPREGEISAQSCVARRERGCSGGRVVIERQLRALAAS